MAAAAGQRAAKSPDGSGVAGAAQSPEGSANLRAAPELTFIDINGATVRTRDYKGKVVVVNFWAAWCGPCAEEVPQFVALQKKYEGEGLQVIGISVEDDAGKLRDFCREHQVNYPVVPSDLRIADAFGGVLGLPTTFVIGRDSRIHAKQEGTVDFPSLEREVVALLGLSATKAGANAGTNAGVKAGERSNSQ